MSFTSRRVMQWLKIVLGNLGRARTFGIAAEMAFWLFLSLLPLAAVAGLVVARFAMRDAGATSGLLATVPPAVRDLLTRELARVSAWNEGAVAPLAALTFIWLASSGVHAIFDGLEVETEALARPWWKKRLLAIAACVALSIGVALIAALSVGLQWMQRFAADAVAISTSGLLSRAVRLAISGTIAVSLLAGLYWVGLPPRVRKRMPLIPGAVVAVALQTVLGIAYGFYVRKAGDGGAYQGALGVIGVTLIVAYLFCIALLVGAEINQLLGMRRLLHASVHPEIAPPPPVTENMVCCEDEPDRERRALRPSWAG